MRRTAAVDTEIAGQKIAAGDKLVMWYNSANRDETKFAEPDRFDVLRNPNPHLGFGGGGRHTCLGAHLARLEIPLLFEAVFANLHDIEPAGPAVLTPSRFVNGLASLPITFKPA
jgi:cytochrome P450